MRWKSFLVLFGILLASVLLLYSITRTIQPPEPKKELVFTGNRKDIRSLEFLTPRWEIEIFKKGGGWVSKSRPSGLDQGLIEEVLDDLLSIEMISAVGKKSELDQKQFGFTKPFMLMTIHYEAGKREHLSIGGFHPTMTAYYAIKDGEEDIFLIGSFYGTTLSYKLEKLLKEESPPQ